MAAETHRGAKSLLERSESISVGLTVNIEKKRATKHREEGENIRGWNP